MITYMSQIHYDYSRLLVGEGLWEDHQGCINVQQDIPSDETKGLHKLYAEESEKNSVRNHKTWPTNIMNDHSKFLPSEVPELATEHLVNSGA